MGFVVELDGDGEVVFGDGEAWDAEGCGCSEFVVVEVEVVFFVGVCLFGEATV